MTEGQKTIAIYGLTCPTTGKVRYVGRSHDPEARLEQHLREAQNNYYRNRRVYEWLRELLKQELKPNLTIIEKATEDTWAEREWYWITHYGLENLYNTKIKSPKLPPPPSGRSRMKRRNVHLTERQTKRLEEYSGRIGLSVAEIIRRFVDDGLERIEFNVNRGEAEKRSNQ